jgi:ATP-dependent RNA helicase DDX23/PRP28
MNGSNTNNNGGLDPSLLAGLTEDQKHEALAAAASAQRAEERAEQRALERAMQRKQEERKAQAAVFATVAAAAATAAASIGTMNNSSSSSTTNSNKIVFVSKRNRQEASAASQTKTQEEDNHNLSSNNTQQQQQQQQQHSKKAPLKNPPAALSSRPPFRSSSQQQRQLSWSEKERKAVQQTYMGKSGAHAEQEELAAQLAKRKSRKGPNKKKITFRFEWDNTDDTLEEGDPLYATTTTIKKNNNNNPRGARPGGANNNNNDNNNNRKRKKLGMMDDYSRSSNGRDSFQTKPIDKMTPRDWRIFRENYEIVVRGGRAPPPLRSFREPSPNLPKLHPALLDAIENVMMYKQPTPIQRQAIPIGLQRRDLIGIAETGSGKTAAFGVPLLHYLMYLPLEILNRVAEDGPLAVVLAPTRELALQIHGEFQKLLSRQDRLKACVVVGGQAIQQQALELRQGVHVVVGTPGRMNDCIEMAYMVLNQCCYIVLDEADRMIDMGK